MKLILLLLLAATVLAQAPKEDYPGQTGHGAPPAGWMCRPQNYQLNVPPEHACSCERSCDPDTGAVVEDKTCKVWCHADHCACEMGNKKACK